LVRNILGGGGREGLGHLSSSFMYKVREKERIDKKKKELRKGRGNSAPLSLGH